MKALKSRMITMVAFATLMSGCYYDNQTILYPESNTCKSVVNPAFASDITPILVTRCTSCHTGTSSSDGIDLSTYSEVIKYVNNGSLMGSIKQLSGFSPMPKNTGKLSPCEIDKIQQWISAGAQNN